MDTLSDFDEWFESRFRVTGERLVTLGRAVHRFLELGGLTIVETGAMRDPFGGSSTLIFGSTLQRYGCGRLWSCDISPVSIEAAKKFTKSCSERTTFVQEHSVEFLRAFPFQIDLLYLDSMDCDPEGDSSAAQEYQKEELLAAYDRLSPKATVLMDDNGFANGGKTLLSKAVLAERGWKCLADSTQALWARE